MFNVNGLSNYTEKATQLLRELALYSPSMGRFTYETGVQHKRYVNYLSTEAYVMAGACQDDFTPSGDTALTEKEVSVTSLMFRDQWCTETLNTKDLNFATGTLNGVMVQDLQTQLVAGEAQSIKKSIEKLIFKGNTASGDLFDGLITKFAADADVIDIPSVAVDVNNIDNILQDMALAINEPMYAMNQHFYIHVPLEYYNLYKQNRINNNFYHDDVNKNNGLTEQGLFGWSNVTIVSEPALTGTKTMFLTYDSNIIVATDDIFEISSAKMYFSEDTGYVRYKASMKLGVEYFFGNHVIMFVGA
jgi:hypothetical protein